MVLADGDAGFEVGDGTGDFQDAVVGAGTHVHLGDGIINDNSLHGQFLSLYKARITELRQKIDEQLNFLAPLPNNRERTIVSGLPNNRYPLGSCVRIKIDNSSYLLIAVTRFNKYEYVEVSTEEYSEIIRKMFNGIEQLHDGMAAYLPLVGGEISGYELTDTQIIFIIARNSVLLCPKRLINLRS